jgi:F420-dependent oxidoreductase-like protein
MKLGYSTLAWGSGPPSDAVDGVAEAERLGVDSIWTSEAYAADAFTPLAWWGSRTSTPRLGTAIAQMSARTPTATAMAALTLDHLSGGRMVLGLGASGPQVVEGWYGQPFARPLERTREYVAIVRQVLHRESELQFAGRQLSVPLVGGTGLGKPLKSVLHPVRRDLPVMLGAEGPKNIALAAEIADGWIPMWFSPKSDAWARTQLAGGFSERADDSASFEVVAPVYMRIADDAEDAADEVRPYLALYIGGMGAASANFHHDVFVRMGWAEVCDEVQRLYLDGEKAKAAAAIPLELVEDVALVGPLPKIREDLQRWRSTVITTMALKCPPAALGLVREEFA